MNTVKKILVTGATGKQGGAVIEALLSSRPTPPFTIVALTRNLSSNRAKSLSSKSNVSVIEGDLNDCAAIFQKTGPVWGVFSVQANLLGKAEETQGKALFDAAAANGVQRFVYTSADRGGPENSENDPTSVPHFITKFNIEKHVQDKASTNTQGLTWTILRPTAFYDNLTPDFAGKGFAAMWRGLGDKKLPLVSVRDVGIIAARAFTQPEQYTNKAISIAGDELTYEEANEIFRSEFGREMPTTFMFVGNAIKWAIRDMGMMFAWFKSDGMKADIPALRKQFPELQDFRRWLRESSGFKK
ncbi:MAG: hypothetical protein M1835_003153 [Candelina submexicana]|nr:MAG: hypothetical protein M1835_003153 [Candelina submexicana]